MHKAPPFDDSSLLSEVQSYGNLGFVALFEVNQGNYS
jgi:hypothetical protein